MKDYITEKGRMSEERKDEKDALDMNEKLLESRTIVISQQVDSKLANRTINQLILLEQSDSKAPITVFINSPGGEVYSGFAIWDMLNFIECPITTIVSGFAASMGSVLSLAASPGRRFAFPHSKVMIHQPLLTGYQGRATDCEIQAKEILRTRDIIIDIYCKSTGKGYEEIKDALDRDNWFTGQEAVEFNLLDGIIESRSQLNAL